MPVKQEEQRQLLALQLFDEVSRAIEVRLAHRTLALGHVDKPRVELGQLGDDVLSEVDEDAVEVVNGAKPADVRCCRRRLLSNFYLKILIEIVLKGMFKAKYNKTFVRDWLDHSATTPPTF